jgi:hypothetical protein
MMSKLLLCTVLVAGCYSEEPDPVYPTATSPDLVEVSPGVQVIADYDYPVFYSDGLWWRYDNGLWYRSYNYYGGWGVSYNVPLGVRGIYNPGGYAHWHGGRVYDHRTYNGYRAGGYDRRGWGRAPAVRASPGQMSRPSRPMARGSFHAGARAHGGGGHRR